MDAVADWIKQRSQHRLLNWSRQQEAAVRFETSIANIERIALEQQILPARYERQSQLVSRAQQLQFFLSTVAVVGCGGLGGHVVQDLARLGVGTIIILDFDVFEEHNLNRQSLATLADLGRLKVEVAQLRIAEINPAVTVITCPDPFDVDFDLERLMTANVVVDAVDNIETRLMLAAACRKLKKPLVHGALHDWFGQVATVLPGDALYEKVYGGKTTGTNQVNTLSFVATAVAALQVAQICKLLLHNGSTGNKRLLNLDLLDMEFIELFIG